MKTDGRVQGQILTKRMFATVDEDGNVDVAFDIEVELIGYEEPGCSGHSIIHASIEGTSAEDAEQKAANWISNVVNALTQLKTQHPDYELWVERGDC